MNISFIKRTKAFFSMLWNKIISYFHVILLLATKLSNSMNSSKKNSFGKNSRYQQNKRPNHHRHETKKDDRIEATKEEYARQNEAVTEQFTEKYRILLSAMKGLTDEDRIKFLKLYKDNNLIGATMLYCDEAYNMPFLLFDGDKIPALSGEVSAPTFPYNIRKHSDGVDMELFATIKKTLKAEYPNTDLRKYTPVFIQKPSVVLKDKYIFQKKCLLTIDHDKKNNRNEIIIKSQNHHKSEYDSVLIGSGVIIYILIAYIKVILNFIEGGKELPDNSVEKNAFSDEELKTYFSEDFVKKLEEFAKTGRVDNKSLISEVVALKMNSGDKFQFWSREVDAFIKKTYSEDVPEKDSEDVPEKDELSIHRLFHENMYFPILTYLVMYHYIVNNHITNTLPAHLVIPLWQDFGVEIMRKDNNDASKWVMYGIITINDLTSWNDCRLLCGEFRDEKNKDEIILTNENILKNNYDNIYRCYRKIARRTYDESILNFSRQHLMDLTRGELAMISLRNYQHNIGSHVMSYYSSADTLREINVNEKGNCKSCILDNQSDSFVELARLNKYVNDRIAYCNEMNRGVSTLSQSYDLKSVMEDFLKQRLLLNKIAGNDDFEFEIDCTYNNEHQVSFPGGQLGKHAFYNIIENVIRNTAKHAIGTIGESNIFEISFDDYALQNESLVKVSISSGFKESSKVEDLVKKINDFILEPFINPRTRTSRRHELGLVEMKCAAAFLRKVDIAGIDSEQSSSLPLLKAVEINGCLGYEFFLKTKTDVLLIGRNVSLKYDGKSLNVRQIDATKEEVIKNSSFCDSTFVIYDDTSDSENELHQIDTMISLRRIAYSKVKECLVTKAKTDISLEDLWECWYRDNESDWKYKYVYNGNPKNGDDIAVLMDHAEDGKDSFEKYEYVEALSSIGQSYLPGFSNCMTIPKYFSEIRKHVEYKYGLLESINAKIAIIDERIQQYAYTHSEYDIPLYKHYQKALVSIPDTENFNLNNRLQKCEDQQAALDKLEDYIQEHENDTFIVIHYGILEKWFTDDGNEKKIDKIGKWLVDKDNRIGARIVITSGRGIPHGIPEKIRVISWTSIQTALIDIRSKYLLSNVLYQSRSLNGTQY